MALLDELIGPYFDVLMAIGIIGIAILLVVWPLILVSLSRFFPQRYRTPILAAGALACLVGTWVYYQGMPADSLEEMRWRQSALAEVGDWEEFERSEYWVDAYGLDFASPRPEPPPIEGFVHGNIRAVTAMDSWFVSRRLVRPAYRDLDEGQSFAAGTISAFGRLLCVLIYGLIWTPLLRIYAWISPFALGAIVIGVWLLTTRRRKVNNELTQRLFGASPVPWFATSVVLLALLGAPFSPVAAPAESLSDPSVEPELAGLGEAPGADSEPAELDLPESEPLPEFEAIAEEEGSSEPIEVLHPEVAEPWPDTVEVDDLNGRIEIRSAPDLFESEVLARAYNNATLAITGEQVCGEDRGLWIPVRLESDFHEDADRSDRDTEGWVEVQAVEPHRWGCCEDRQWDCIPWPDVDMSTYEEVPITATEANVISRVNVRSEPGNFPTIRNRVGRLRTDHLVTIEREVCAFNGFRWAYVRYERLDEDSGVTHRGEGWVFRPGLTPNANGCCNGRTGSDPQCMDGAEAFFEEPPETEGRQ